MKIWTYKKLTEQTEQQIKILMKQASEEPDHEMRSVFRGFAKGAYLLWVSITLCSQNDGDDERLQKLTKD